MDSLQHILGNRDFTPPDEINTIRQYVMRRYKSNCKVQLQRDTVIVSVVSSALAATLRLEQRSLIESCNLKQRLIIRIGR